MVPVSVFTVINLEPTRYGFGCYSIKPSEKGENWKQ